MLVQLQGTCFLNAGDVLMLQAAIARLSGSHTLDISDSYDTHPDAIIDVCGYWLGDPWMPADPAWVSKAERFAQAVRRWKREGTAVILLPQTFGPFLHPTLAQCVKEIVEDADLVCARDVRSLSHLHGIAGSAESLRLYPDYTQEVRPYASSWKVPPHAAAVIPNARLLDKAGADSHAAYLPFLRRVIDALRNQGKTPFFLIHESGDERIAEAMISVDASTLIRREPNPRALRSIIAQCDLVVSSRYHGVLGALYEQAPVLATSWNHKFDALMQTYGLEHLLMNVDAPSEEIIGAISHTDDPRHRAAMTASMASANVLHAEAAGKMWTEVLSVLALHAGRQRIPALTSS